MKFSAKRSSGCQNHSTFLSLHHDYQETESASATSVAAASPRFYSVTNYLPFPIQANFYLFIYIFTILKINTYHCSRYHLIDIFN